MNEGNIARHRNYSLLMKRHHRDLRIRRLTIAMIYVLLIIVLLGFFLIMKKDEQRKRMPATPPATAIVSPPAALHPIEAPTC